MDPLRHHDIELARITKRASNAAFTAARSNDDADRGIPRSSSRRA